MKRTIEILLRLVAPPARLVALLFAVCAASGARATDSLEETGGFVTSTATLAFKNVKLADLSADTLSAKFAGSWVTGKGAAVTFCDLSLSGSTLTCEAQIHEATTDFTGVKVIYLTFTQSGSDINVQATNVKSLSGGTLGTPVGSGGSQVNSGSPATSYTGAGYGLYNLHLPRSYYRFNGNMPAVVWDGDFEQTKYDGNGNAYTLTLPTGITLSNGTSGNLVVGDTATTGASVAIPATGTNIAVLVKYSGLETKSTQAFAPIGLKGNDGNYLSMRPSAVNALTVKGYWQGSDNLFGSGTAYNANNAAVATLSEGSGYLMISYNCRNSENGVHMRVYAGATIASMTGGNCGGLRFTNASRTLSYLYLGGPGETAKASAWAGLTIEKVAIFFLDQTSPMGVSTDEKSKMFFRPRTTGADASAYYEKFGNANAILTWETAADAAGNNGDFMAYADVKYNIFDSVTGADSGVIETGGATAGNVAAWQRFCYGQSAYNAPGQVLRLVSGYYSNIHGKFSPLSLGGLIVEEGATGYIVSQSDNARSFSLGDPIGKGESYFEVNEDFTINRTAGGALMGTVNIDVADGKTFTVASSVQIAKAWNSTSGGTGLPTVKTTGGVLKFHGAGQFAVASGKTLTATGSTLDYSDLAASRATPFVSGALAVDGDTVFKFPASAAFPYPVATSVSSTASGDVTFHVGSSAYTRELWFNSGYACPERRATFAGGGTAIDWSSLVWDISYADETRAFSRVTASASGTLALGAVTTDKVILEVPQGVELTLTGTLAASEIVVTGAGTVVCSAANTLQGTVTGDGTLVYDNLTPSGATFTNDAWEGVLWFKNGTRTNMDASALAGANSTLRLTGVTGYFTYGKTSTGALDLQDDGATKAFTLSDGWSDYNPTVFAKLTGSGTLAASNTGVSHRYVFKDPSAFSGTIDMSGKVFRIILGDNTSLSPAKDGTITVVSGATVNIAAGKTWTSDGGIEVDGTLNLGAGATVPKLKSGSDGMVVVVSGTATVAGIDSSAISPTLGIVGTLAFADTTTTELTLTAEKLSNSGTLDLSGCTAVTTMNLVFGSTRSGYLFGRITPPPNLATVNVAVTEVLSEDGVASLTIPASLTGAATLNVTVTGLDGTTKTVTKSVSGSVLSVSYTPTVFGAACWCAYEMEYESGTTTGFENSGSDNSGLTPDSGIEGSDAFTDDGMLYTYAHPWRDITYPTDGNWTAVVRCTVPAYENAAVITFGTCNGGLIGLVAGADPETQMRLVQTTGNSHFVTNATMTVQNATTAQHVYIFSVETNQTVKVYCDGDQVLNKTFDSQFTIGGGIQVGSVHGGIHSTGIVRFAKDESPANDLSETVQKAARIDCVRLYKTALGPNAIAQLSVEFPAVKLYRATVAANATTTWDALTWSPAWNGGNEYSKIILTTEGDATLTLPDSITADEFTINVASDSTLTLAKAAGGTTMTVSKLEIDDGTVAVADANFFGSHAINGTGTLKITTTGALTSALSGNAKVEIPSNVAVGVTTGSIANTITGAGTLTYVLALPATAPTFSGWTGTVQIPAITTGSVNLNNYGVADSTVAVSGISNGAWLSNEVVLPTINVSSPASITLTEFSSTFANTINKLTGDGTFSLTKTGDGCDGYFLLKDISDFTGSISVAAPGLAIGASKPASPTTYGHIYLTTSATIASGKTWTASNGIVLGTTDVTLTNADGALATAPTSGVENYKVVSVAGEAGEGRTEYSLAVDGVIVDGEDGIIVTSDWLTDNGLSNATASDLTAARAAGENSNGYSYYACYALGLDPTKEEDKPEVRVTTDANGKFVITLTDKDGNVLDVADNVAVTLSVKTGTNPETVTGEGSEGEIVAGEGTGEDQSFVIDPTKVESVKYYKVQINIRAK